MSRWVAALFVLAVGTGYVHAADKQCAYDMQVFGEGTTTCQKGRQFRCVGGGWKDVGTTCADEDPVDSGVKVEPGVDEPKVREPSVQRPAAPSINPPQVP